MYATNFRAAWSSAAVLVLAGCASLQVRTDYDQQASFTPLSTYDWNGGEVEAGSNPAVNKDRSGSGAPKRLPDVCDLFVRVRRSRVRLIRVGCVPPTPFV